MAKTELSEQIAELSECGDLLVLSGAEIAGLLTSRERDATHAVAEAYLAHQAERDCLPHSVFLRPPGAAQSLERIIALPAYLNDASPIAGVKWIASYPNNLKHNMERASAAIILNSTANGRPFALLEGSVISACRTAASASLAAGLMAVDRMLSSVSLIGCGVVNFEIARFLSVECGAIREVVLFDLDSERAEAFGDRCVSRLGVKSYRVAPRIENALGASRVISFATTAGRPYVTDLSCCQPGAAILHISLRDLHPDVILQCENVVDDVDHVCRANTSIHLAEMQTGTRAFIRGTIGQVMQGSIPARDDIKAIAVFSPFGLGTLDMAVARLCVTFALQQGIGSRLKDFLPVVKPAARPRS